MSIWSSHDHIGTDHTIWNDLATGEPVGPVTQRGHVLSYADGYSNHRPDLTGSHERPAMIETAHIPAHVGGAWLRLAVEAPETLNFWDKSHGDPAVERREATVVMDCEAARSLRDDLTWWLNWLEGDGDE